MPTLSEIKALRGSLSPRRVVSGRVQAQNELSGQLNKNGRYREYHGPYEVYPTEYDQFLPTEDKLLTDDVTVHEIPLDLATREQIDELFE